MGSYVHFSPTYYAEDSVIGGGERYILYMARSLINAAKAHGRDHTMTLIAFGDTPRLVMLDDDIACHVMRGRPWDATSLDGAEIRKAASAFDGVFVHQCLSAFGLFIAAQARIEGKLVIGMDHGGGEHPIVPHTPAVGAIFDLFLAQSGFAAKTFSDIEGPVLIARGPVDTGYYAPSANRRDDREVVAIGRVLPHKGFDRIIAALPEGLRLTIIGSAYDEAYLRHLGALAGDKPVTFEQGLSDEQVRARLGRAGLFVHASTHVDYRGTYYAKPELLGLAPLEALACGTPTLTSSAGSLAELGVVAGCKVFADDAALAQMMQAHARSEIEWPTEREIHDDVEAKFGMARFGEEVLRHLELI